MGRTEWRQRERRAARAPKDYSRLPDRVDPADMVTSEQVDPPRDPEGGRDTERDFMLRNAGGF